MPSEIKQGQQIPNRRSVRRPVGVFRGRDRIRQIVAAAVGQFGQAPVVLDELQDGGVIAIAMIDMPALGIRRYHDHGNARTVAKKVENLNESAVEVTAALIGSDQDRRVRPQLRVRLDLCDHIAHEVLVTRLDRVARVATVEIFRNQEAHSRQGAAGHVPIERSQPLQPRLQCRLRHDRGGGDQGIANVVVLQASSRIQREMQRLHLRPHVRDVPRARIPTPAHTGFAERFGDGRYGLRRVVVVVRS